MHRNVNMLLELCVFIYVRELNVNIDVCMFVHIKYLLGID
jgi:hypothetical protein